jgi:rsbT co-antagonist protein RsbR
MKQAFINLTTIQSDDAEIQRRGSIAIYTSLVMLVAGIILLVVALAYQNWPWVVNLCISSFGLLCAIYVVHKGKLSFGGILLILVIALDSTGPLITNGSQVYGTTFFLTSATIATSLILPPKYTWFTMILNSSLILFIWYQVNGLAMGEADGSDLLLSALACNIIAAIFAFLSATVLVSFLRRVEQVRSEVKHHSNLLKNQNTALEQRIMERTEELKIALQEVEQQANEYDSLLAENERQRSIIREMHTPIIPVSDSTLIAPLVGELDERYFNMFSTQALQELVKTRARYLIIDISGVPFINNTIGQLFLQIVSAAKLLGTEVLLVGMRPDVAHIAVNTGLNTMLTRSFSSLEIALNELNYLKQLDTGPMLPSFASSAILASTVPTDAQSDT